MEFIDRSGEIVIIRLGLWLVCLDKEELRFFHDGKERNPRVVNIGEFGLPAGLFQETSEVRLRLTNHMLMGFLKSGFLELGDFWNVSKRADVISVSIGYGFRVEEYCREQGIPQTMPNGQYRITYLYGETFVLEKRYNCLQLLIEFSGFASPEADQN